MRFLTFFISGVLIIAILASGASLFYEKSFNSKALEEEVFSSLISIAESKANQVKSFLQEKKEDAAFLAKTAEVKEIFYDELSTSTEKELRYFQEINAYRDLFLINEAGKIIWSTVLKDGIKYNFKNGVYQSARLTEIYKEAKESGDISISNIKFEKEDEISIFVAIPVLNGKEDGRLGYLVLQINNFQLEKMMLDEDIMDGMGEIYLINKNKFNITPLKFIRSENTEEGKVYYSNASRKMDSESINTCLTIGTGSFKNLKFYENYAADKIFGTHQYIPEVSWCVLAEINQNEFFKNTPNQFRTILWFFILSNLGVLALCVVISLILTRYFVLNKRKNEFQKANRLFCKIFLTAFLLVVIILNCIWLYKIYVIPNRSFIIQARNHLLSVAESRKKRVKDYLKERERDVKFLAGSQKIKELLKKEVATKVDYAKKDTNYFSEIISKEIENYLKANSRMTLENLRKSREFRQIAVQQIGQTGYSTVMGVDSSITYFHKNQKIEGVSIFDLLPTDHSLLDIMERARANSGEAEGKYKWVDLGGLERDKYITSKKVSVETFDDEYLMIAATAYIDEYKIIKDVPLYYDKYLNNFKKILAYHNLLLISPDDYIVYMAKDMQGLGANLKFSNDGLSRAYLAYLKEDKEASFYGPFAYHHGEIALKISLMSPVYEGDRFLGTVVLVFDMSEITRIASELAGLGETGENYLANKEGYLISPLRFKYFDFLVQTIKTENLLECFKDYRKAKEKGISVDEYEEQKIEEEEEKVLDLFENYRGKLSTGVHAHISELNWCLLTEMEHEEIFESPKKERQKKEIMILAIMTVFMLAFIYFKGRCVRKDYIVKKK